MKSSPYERIIDIRAVSRSNEFHAKNCSRILRMVLGSDRAEIVTRKALSASINGLGQINKQKFSDNLEYALSWFKLQEIKKFDFMWYCTIQNIECYDNRNSSNKEQIISELLVKSGYRTLNNVRSEFPHLWNHADLKWLKEIQ